MQPIIKSILLLTTWIMLGFGTSHAQELEGCKNPCKKTKIVQIGPLIGLRTLTLPDSQYVRVIEVVKRGASQKAGIMLGDTLTHFNGKVIQNMNYFIAEVAKLQPGDTITVTVRSNQVDTIYRYPLGAAETRKVTVIECCDEPEPEPELNNIIFVLSPNPANEYLRVSSYEVIKPEITLDIQDANGNVLKSEKVKKSKGNFEATLDIKELPNGVYFLKIYVENTKYVQRFVKEG